MTTRFVLSIAVALTLTGCSAGYEAPKTLKVLFGGCAEVIAGPHCVLANAADLTLWLAETDADVLVDNLAPVANTISRATVDGGEQIKLHLPRDARTLTVQSSEGVFKLALSVLTTNPALERAKSLSDDTTAIAALKTVLNDMPSLAGAVHGAMARRYLRGGEHDLAMQSLRAARSAYRDAGYTLSAVRESAALTYFLIHRERAFAVAAEELNAADDGGTLSADASYHIAYHRALVAFNSGDPRRALTHLNDAATLTRRLGWTRRSLHVEQILAVQLQALGRRSEARQLLEQWTDERLDAMAPCDHAMLINNRAWASLLQREASERAPDPTDDLRLARQISDEHCPKSEHINIRVNLALAAVQVGDDGAAERHLRQARELSSTPEPRQRHWMLDIEARLQQRRADTAAALATYANLERLGEQESAVDARWRARIGRAQTLAAAERLDEALASFESAHALIREQVLNIPLTQGRESFLAQRDSAWRQHVALLLASKQPARALAVVRDARRDAIRGFSIDHQLVAMDEKTLAAWRTAVGSYHAERDALSATVRELNIAPADQLTQLRAKHNAQQRQLAQSLDAALAVTSLKEAQRDTRTFASDALAVTLVRLDRNWALFAQQGANLTVYEVSCTGVASIDLPTCLLAPLQPIDSKVQVLYVFSSDDDAGLELAAASIGTGRLIDALPLRYLVDLPSQGQDISQRDALLLADPDGSLVGAQREVEAVADILGDAKWSLQRPTGESMSSLALGERIAQAKLFHFAGHARSAGVLGWDSALQLARGEQLSIGDILALTRAPTYVVLSGCETGATTIAGDGAAGVGLAQAFLSRGSELVLATTRPVRDNAAHSLMTDYYQAWQNGQRPEVALQQAQQRARDRGDDWAAFRLLSRLP